MKKNKIFKKQIKFDKFVPYDSLEPLPHNGFHDKRM